MPSNTTFSNININRKRRSSLHLKDDILGMKNLMWLEIDLVNLRHNIKNLKGLIKPKVKFMAVVKSNAYGHGAIECAKAALAEGADWLGVVNLAEGAEIRANGVEAPVLVMGYAAPEEAIIAARQNISIAVVNFEQLKQLLNSQMVKLLKNRKLKIHLKIETGISRLGFAENDWPKLIKEIKKLPSSIKIEGVYSHFASVEEYDLAYAKKQIKKFKQFKDLFEKSSRPYAPSAKPLYHIAASAAVMILPESHFDMVRCGVSIYGLWPSREIRRVFLLNLSTRQRINSSADFLKPVMSYKTKIVQIKEVRRGDCIGYGCTYPVDRPMTTAVIPVGYAEGFDRGFSGPAPVGNKPGEILARGIRCPIVGRVCMNMAIIDISRLNVKAQISNVKIGDEVVLMGRQGSEEIAADEWAEKLGTINYEITTKIPEHIRRVYIK